MQHTYVRFGAKRKTHLPKIISRRQRIGLGRHNICYKSDAPKISDDDDEFDIEEKLNQVKVALETNLSKKQKDNLDKALSPLETELKGLKEITEKNQPVIDAFVVNKGKEKHEIKNKSFEDFLGDTILENQDAVARFARKETKSLVLDLKVVGDMTTGNVTGTRYGSIFSPNITQQPYRKIHVRDFIPISQAGPGNTFTFMREGTGEGDISTVAETSTKPQFDLDLVEASVNFEIIAGWLRVTRKAMNNIPGFIAWLQRRLPEKLMRVEDSQLLYGNGATPNIKGINHADNHVAETSTATVLAERIIDAISQLEDDNERYATAVILRPKEYYGFFKNKATGSGEYDLPRNFIFTNGVLYVSGIPVIPTTAVIDGDFFVGDWLEGAQLLVQDGMRLEFFEQDGTNVRENKVTVRIEESVAFPVFGEDFFIKGEVPPES